MTQPYPAEAVRELNERADWLKSEYLKGGNYEILKAREDECRYLTKKFAALLSYVEGMKWKPIESAPKDGTRLLSHIAHNGRVIIRWANKFSIPHYGDSKSGWYCETLDRRVDPTNWLPLPPPPDSE